MRLRPHLLLVLLTVPLTARAVETPQLTRAQEDFFEAKIRPLLAAKCLECHGPTTQEAGLRIDSRKALMKGSEKYPVVVAGKPEMSPLIKALEHAADLKMPPEEKLPADQVNAFRRWIKMGIPWPGDRPLAKSDSYPAILASHWSLQPIEPSPLPTIKQTSWPATAIDTYILAKLEAANLQPSPVASRRQLIRRVMFDMIGLAPTLDQVKQFVNDPSPDAYQRMIDRVLASPQYGERWSRYWLDLARYSDTMGYNFMKERRFPFSYTYRDYVIRSLNNDKPYDQFLMEQLAADLMQLDDQRDLAGLGFLTIGRRYRNEQLDVDDRIDTMTRGMLGMTVSCARCHDHKYDAIPTADYYSLYGVFASSQIPGDQDLPLIGTPETTPHYSEFKVELDRLEGKLRNYDQMRADKFTHDFRRQLADYLIRAIAAPTEAELKELKGLTVAGANIRQGLVTRWRHFLTDNKQNDHAVRGPLRTIALLPKNQFPKNRQDLLKKTRQLPEGIAAGQINPLLKQRILDQQPENKIQFVRLVADLLQEIYLKSIKKDALLSDAEKQLNELVGNNDTPTHVTSANVTQFYNRDDTNKRQKVLRPVEQHKAFARGNPPRAMVLAEKSKPYDPRIFIRGQAARKGDHVPRQFLYVVSGAKREPFKQGSGRLEMAQAIASPNNTLTARVIANRIWMNHFTTPIVTTPSDFGIRSDKPLQLDVLDYLARLLIDSNWSIKTVHREILLSATYRQASVDHPQGRQANVENSLYWRMNRRRLDYEAMRDALLQALEQLDLTIGGPSVALTESTSIRRRALYTFIDRQDLPGLLRVFDFPNPDQHSAKRPNTTVPQQALFLMNSPVVIERIRRQVQSDESAKMYTEEWINLYYQRLYQRLPTDQERKIGQHFIGQQTKPGANSKLEIWSQYLQLLLLSNEFHFID